MVVLCGVCAGEPGGDVFILMRGELLQLDVDRETTIAKIPEGSVFGETVVLRNLEVGGFGGDGWEWVGGWECGGGPLFAG